jgi:photosystem II stability/assembly factor-like uncharacterized protein
MLRNKIGVLRKRLAPYSVLLAIMFVSGSLHAQWKQIAHLNSTVYTIYFMPGECAPKTGFAGTVGSNIYKTTDGGNNWRLVHFGNRDTLYTSSFTFKDAMNGWCSMTHPGGIFVPDMVYRTTDGGDTWISMNMQGSFPCIYYHQASGKLLLTSWSGSATYSMDGGMSWKLLAPKNYAGVAFRDDRVGVISSVQNVAQYLYTADGGATWAKSNLKIEGYQPFAVPCTNTFLVACEADGNVYRSDDGGASWSFASSVSANGSVMGEIRGDKNDLFVQTSKGVFHSGDMAASWNPINGPGHDYDGRMFTRGGYLFAADDAGGVFNYHYATITLQVGKLTLPDSMHFPTSACNTVKRALHISMVLPCAECTDSVRLTSVKLSGSNSFGSLSTPVFGRGITSDDSIVLTHAPGANPEEFGELTLSFTQYGQSFDTVIHLEAQNISHSSALLRMSTDQGSQNALRYAGDDLHAIVYMQDPIATAVGLTSISCRIPYTDRMLTYKQTTGLNGWNIIRMRNSRTTIDLELQHAAYDMPAGEKIVDVDFKVMLADTNQTDLMLDSTQLNSGDSLFKTCVLAASPSDDTIHASLILRCGDTTILQQLKKEPLVAILSIVPNPIRSSGNDGVLKISVHAVRPTNLHLTIRNVLGESVSSFVRALSSGDQTISVDTRALPEGSYYLTFEAEGSKSVRKIIVERSE